MWLDDVSLVRNEASIGGQPVEVATGGAHSAHRYPVRRCPTPPLRRPASVLLAAPRGYCAGVDRAVQTVERALELHGAPVYVRKEIVHNKHVVEELSKRGAIFVEEETEVPEGEMVVFSAHGVAPAVHENAAAAQPAHDRRHLPAGHQGPRRGAALRRRRLHDRDDRPRGPRGGRRDDRRGAGRASSSSRPSRRSSALEVADPERVAFITQTTLSVDETAEIIAALRARFPAIVSSKSDDICYATTNRQIAVKQLARECDLVLVIGSTNSSNSNRLVEVAREHGAASHLIDNHTQVEEEWLEGVETVGITSGASAPEELVEQLVELLPRARRRRRLRAAHGPRGRALHAPEEDSRTSSPLRLPSTARPPRS